MSLILSRRAGESVAIGADVTVRVTEINGGQVRLAFDAPPTTRIVRDDAHSPPMPPGWVAEPDGSFSLRLAGGFVLSAGSAAVHIGDRLYMTVCGIGDGCDDLADGERKVAHGARALADALDARHAEGRAEA